MLSTLSNLPLTNTLQTKKCGNFLKYPRIKVKHCVSDSAYWSVCIVLRPAALVVLIFVKYFPKPDDKIDCVCWIYCWKVWIFVSTLCGVHSKNESKDRVFCGCKTWYFLFWCTYSASCTVYNPHQRMHNVYMYVYIYIHINNIRALACNPDTTPA